MTLFDEVSSPRRYDAIVIGSGITGGWAAKELTEKGLKVLVLERGRHIEHGDYPTATLDPWDIQADSPGIFKIGDEHVPVLREGLTDEEAARYHVQRRTGWSANRLTARHYVDDVDHPYEEAPGARFDWIRSYQTGGRSLVWGRQSYRWAPIDFEMNARQGIGIDWPIRYRDLEPYYARAEEYIGVSGRAEGRHDRLPDGVYGPPMAFTAPEVRFKEQTEKNYRDGRFVTIGRTAHLTGEPRPGRQLCQFRNRCERGCPYGGYFSSNASTLPAADLTGNLTLRPHSIVKAILRDETTGLATGVLVVDAQTKDEHEFATDLVFLNASTVGSAAILMQSGDWANESGQLGRNLMDHHYQVGAKATVEGFGDSYYAGNRANGYYMPQFVNRGPGTENKDYLRGFGIQGYSRRGTWREGIAEMRYGREFKEEMLRPGEWRIDMGAFGEILPDERNRMTLSAELDQWGLPKVVFDTKLRENELTMRRNMIEHCVDMYERAGFKDVEPYENEDYGMGLGIHEMGTARMGRDPRTSVLDEHNRVHACKNVYVTDGAAMVSAGTVNPSLTYMALTLRATEHATS